MCMCIYVCMCVCGTCPRDYYISVLLPNCVELYFESRILVFPTPSSGKMADCRIQKGNLFHFQVMNIACPESNLHADLFSAAAILALKSKRRFMKQLILTDGQLTNLEVQMDSLQNSILNNEVLGAIGVGAQALKATNEAVYVYYLLHCK